MSKIFNDIANNMPQEKILRNITKDIIDNVNNCKNKLIKKDGLCVLNSSHFINNSNFSWLTVEPYRCGIQDLIIDDYTNFTQNRDNDIGISVVYRIDYDYNDYSLSNINIPDSLITAYEDSFENGVLNNDKYTIYTDKLNTYTTELNSVLTKEWENFKIKSNKSDNNFDL